jgi:amino acid adenylation domain-containing protein
MQRTLALATAPAPQPSILIPDNADNAIRWRPGERLFDVFETTCLALEKEGKLDRIAVEAEGETLSYGALRDRVRGFAAALQARGLAPGERVGLILDRSLDSYCVMLGAIQAGLAYVPLDPKFPADRIAFIAEDANVKAFVAIESAVELAGQSARPVIGLGALATAAAPLIANGVRPALPTERPDDELAYIIYTSGSTGRPKGVAINHSAICNFIAVAAEDYGYLPTDRVYQGLTFAFDFSIEEFWVPLAVGATLVASPSQMQLVGQALDGFLRDHRVTAMCCVPTLLATLENDLPDLRFLLVSGEACPHDLVRRWYRADRRLLNAYGPTEATVTATWTPLHPNRNVTIGVPLATYTIVLLNPEHDELAHPGDTGEIAIGGIGLAEGYVNRPELTAQKFIPDFLNLENNPSGRLYRTGDLGRIDENGEIEYLGRIDTQVKLKGYRIELGEIEEVMLEIDGIAQAVVTLREDSPTGTKDLAGYYTGFEGEGPPSREAVAQALRSRLPAYMVPAFIEPIDAIPLMPSQKADRKALPPPRHPRVTVSSRSFAAPETPTEQAIAECLGDKLGLAQVSVDDHIFDDLGLDSLAAAHVIMALDERFGDGAVSIANLYLHPTVRDLAPRIEAALATQRPRSRAPDVTPASDLAHAICGTLQGATYLVTFAAYAWFFITGLIWTAGAETAAALTGRAILVAGVLFVAPAMIAIAAKWALVGRWQPEQLKLWSLAYFRFWFVRFLVETNPVALFRGSPVFNCYLRLLGAEIGENVLLLTKTVPLATDLIRIGDNTVIRKDVHLTGYRADADTMKIGPVEIGSSAVIGEGAVIDIRTEIGDGGQLAHASALISGQSVPPGERWHGAPATPTDADFAHPSHHTPDQPQAHVIRACRTHTGNRNECARRRDHGCRIRSRIRPRRHRRGR